MSARRETVPAGVLVEATHDADRLMSMVRPNIAQMTSTLFEHMRCAERVSRVFLREMCGECSDADFGKALHKTRERLRDECSIEFVPVLIGLFAIADTMNMIERCHNPAIATKQPNSAIR